MCRSLQLGAQKSSPALDYPSTAAASATRSPAFAMPAGPAVSTPLAFIDSSSSRPAAGSAGPKRRSDIANSSVAGSLAKLPNGRGVPSPFSTQLLPSSAIMSGAGLDDGDQDMSEDQSKPTMVIWGTTVNVEETQRRFKQFLGSFKLSMKIEGGDDTPFYPALFDMMMVSNENGQFNLNLDCENLKCYEPAVKLYNLLIRYPQEVIPIMDCAAEAFLQDMRPDMELPDMAIRVRPFNLGRSVNLRDLDPADIDQLVTVKGLLIRASPVIPDMKVAFFRCIACGQTIEEENDRGRIREPTICPNEACRSMNTVSIVHNRCEFSNKQIAKVQETPDETPDGQTPYTVSMYVYDELVDVGKPGDRLELTAIFRGVPVRVNPRTRSIKSLFKTYLDVVHIRRSDDKRMNVDKNIASAAENLAGESYEEGDRSKETTPEEIRKFQSLSQRPDLYELLSHSVAPSIFGLEDVKKGCLLQLFGGTHKFAKAEPGAPRIRGDLNVLLIGDPGVSKSQLLQYVHKIAPRGIYTSGKGSSAVGLTAYVTRDPDTRQLVLESGALVLSDGGVCCIDEFDKMSDHTRSVLHEVMEQQTISIAKAGIITTLNARTSVLASANPINSKFDPKRSVVENINLAPPLLSRFDLIFLLLDTPNVDHDRMLAKHIVNLYIDDFSGSGVTSTRDFLPIETFTKYINYAKEFIQPRISKQASTKLVNIYTQMRMMGKKSGRGKTVTATTRQLESMIRLSEAHARMRLSPIVQECDVEEAQRLIEAAMLSSAIDPQTGLVDFDLIQTGTSARSRDMEEEKRRELRVIISEMDKPSIRFADVFRAFREARNENIQEREVDKLLDELADMDYITVTGRNFAEKMIRKKNTY